MTSTAESTTDSASVGTAPVTPNPPTQQTWENPIHEAERRFADQAPVWPVAHAAGLQNMRGIWADAELKRKIDRAVQAKQLGVEDALKDGNEEVPGDINIKGDEIHNETHQHYYPPPATTAGKPPTDTGGTTTGTNGGTNGGATNGGTNGGTPAPAPPPTTGSTNTSSTTIRDRIRTGAAGLIPAVLVGGTLVGAGVGGTMLYHALTDKPSSVTTITQPGGQFEYRYGIDQRPTPK